MRDGLEGNDQMTLGGEGVLCFAVGGEVFVAPEDIGRGSGDDAAHRTTSLGRECHLHSSHVTLNVPSLRRRPR